MKNFSSVTKAPPGSHQNIIRKALDEGFSLFDEYCETKKSTTPQLSLFFANFLSYQKQLFGNKFFEKPDVFYSEQNKLYSMIYSPEYMHSDEMKLFLEFMLGLCRFYLALKLFLKFSELIPPDIAKPSADEIIPEKCQCLHCKAGSLFWQQLHNVSILCKTRISALILSTNNFQSVSFWDNAEKFFNLFPNLKKLATHIVSMQYVPVDKKFLGLAQVLHFGGFGGNGVLLNKYTELTPLLEHKIGYHDKGTGGFNARFGVILAQLKQSKEYASTVGAELLLRYSVDEPLKILDVGSGPTFAGAASIVEALLANDRKVELTASDIDTDGIAQLLSQQAKHTELVDIRYFDLNFVNDVANTDIVENEFDAITASLVLHQLDYSEIEDSLRFFIRITKPGGYILNTDVGKDAYYQSLLIPANAVDREGHVIPWDEFDIRKTAVHYSEKKLKIAYPIRKLIKSFPSSDQELYVFVAYKILAIPDKIMDQLAMLWVDRDYIGSDMLINQYCNDDLD